MERGYLIIAPLIALHLILAGGKLIAQVASPSYTVDDLVKIALDKHEPLKAQEAKVRETASLGRHLSEWYNPELSLTAGRKSTPETTGSEMYASVTQRISFPGRKGAAAEIALLDEGKARLSLEEMRLFIRYEVTRLAYEYAYDLERANHKKDRLNRLRLINAYMQGRVIISPQKRVERSILLSRIAMLEKEVYKIGNDAKSSYARLNLYTAFSGASLPVVRVKWFSTAPRLDAERLAGRAKSDGFLVRTQREEVKAARRSRELAGMGAYPDVGVSLYYNEERMDVRDRTFGGGVSFPLPLFSRNRHAEAAGGEKERAEEHRLKHLEHSVAMQMEELFARYEYAAALVKVFPMRKLAELDEDMRYTDSEFRRGRVALVSYLEMDTQIHEAIEEIYRTQLDLVNVYTSILFLAAEERPVEGDLRW